MIPEGGSVQDARLHRVDSGEEICRCEWLERLQGRPLTFEMRNPRGPAGQPFDPSRMNGDFAIYADSIRLAILRGVRKSEDPRPLAEGRWRGAFESIE